MIRAERIFRQISVHSPRTPLTQRSTEAQRRLIARLIIDTGAVWDDSIPTPITVYRASSLIDTLKSYEAVGGYDKWIKGYRT